MSTTNAQRSQISQTLDEHNIHAIMKTMRPLGYHNNGLVTTHALSHMMYLAKYIYICIYI